MNILHERRREDILKRTVGPGRLQTATGPPSQGFSSGRDDGVRCTTTCGRLRFSRKYCQRNERREDALVPDGDYYGMQQRQQQQPARDQDPASRVRVWKSAFAGGPQPRKCYPSRRSARRFGLERFRLQIEVWAVRELDPEMVTGVGTFGLDDETDRRADLAWPAFAGFYFSPPRPLVPLRPFSTLLSPSPAPTPATQTHASRSAAYRRLSSPVRRPLVPVHSRTNTVITLGRADLLDAGSISMT
ncbi:hypothetical protein QTP88_027906 [Uroleucon formosanum]